jgi:hypothetical protein
VPTKRAILRDALLVLLHEHEADGALPTSNRFLFYELVQRGIISKEKTGARRPDQYANEALASLREDGEIPWDWIVDETRSIDSYTGYQTIREGTLRLLSVIELDPWQGEEPLVLTESRSLAGVLRGLASEYRIRLCPTNGQCGGFLHTSIAPILRPLNRVLYLGDWDLCGNMIEANTRRVLEREAGALRWERLALTAEQVQQYELISKHDRRFKDGGAHEAVETEALSQRIIVEIVGERLAELLPESLESVHERAERERAVISRLLNR